MFNDSFRSTKGVFIVSIGKQTKSNAKARYWWAVLYPENMLEDWKDQIDDLLQLPYEYCVHDKDIVNDPDEQRKVHVHLIIAFPNTTTYKNAFNTFDRLSADGRKSLNKCEQIISIEYAHKYLIHDTDKCKKDLKYLYDPSERVSGNLFDIGSYIQLCKSEEQEIFNCIVDTIYQCCFESFMDVDRHFRYSYEYQSEDAKKYYQTVLRGHYRYFECLCKGIHFKKEQFYKLNLSSSEEIAKKIERDRIFISSLKDELKTMSEKAKSNFQ